MNESTAPKTATVTDRRGRTFTMRRPTILAQLDLVEIVGGDLAKNDVYMSMVLPILYLTEIDGELELPPGSMRELRGLVQRLDDDGLAPSPQA